MQVIKRDGRRQKFDKEKIYNAVSKAFIEVDKELTEQDKKKALEIADYIESLNKNLKVEEVQDIVEDKLMASNRKDVARCYIRYRYLRGLVRESNTTDKTIFELLNGTNEYWNSENANKNAKVVTVQRDYIAGITSTDITRRFLLPKDIVEAHDAGIIHFHDADYFAQNALHNCELINLEDMLQNGTMINNILIEKPHRFLTAATIATQIITSSSYGGATITLTALAPFVRSSYNKYYDKYKKRGMDDETCKKYAMEDTKKEIEDGVQTFNYQVNSMTNTNGQSPFLSVCMYLGETEEYKEELALIIEEFLKQRILGLKNEKGVYITQAFPKLLYVLEEDNIKEDGNPKYYGRFNQGVVTISLPDVALSSKKDMEEFWKIFEERLELCHRALQIRHERLAHAISDIAPILWQHGALARLEKGESIHELLHNGYSTISLGYAGLYECVKYMTGNSHTDNGVGKEFALEVMKKLNDKCAEWKKAEKIDYSVYGTPIESTTYKFAKCLRNRFGIIEGITDRDYITNSYHVPVFEKIDPFTKLALESEFQKLSPGGAISYIECADLTNNVDAVIEVIKFIYDHIMYAELNTKSDYCQVCGYDGEIKIVDEDGKLDWQCPNCGNMDHSKMNVARRTCGYIGTNFFNQGRTDEIRNRYVHLDNHKID